MPKSLKQEIIYGIMMVFAMVYAMVCYNVTLNVGGMQNFVFAAALHELPIMCPLAFIFDFFVVGPIAKKITFRIFNPAEDKPLFIILMISVLSIWMMCPYMSLIATILFKNGLQPEFFFGICGGDHRKFCCRGNERDGNLIRRNQRAAEPPWFF